MGTCSNRFPKYKGFLNRQIEQDFFFMFCQTFCFQKWRSGTKDTEKLWKIIKYAKKNLGNKLRKSHVQLFISLKTHFLADWHMYPKIPFRYTQSVTKTRCLFYHRWLFVKNTAKFITNKFCSIFDKELSK